MKTVEFSRRRQILDNLGAGQKFSVKAVYPAQRIQHDLFLTNFARPELALGAILPHRSRESNALYGVLIFCDNWGRTALGCSAFLPQRCAE